VATVAAEYQELRSRDVIVFFISTDSPHTHKAWQEHEINEMVEDGVHWPMLGDQGGKIGDLYGVYDEELGTDQRSHFLIDPDGNISASEIVIADIGRDIDELLRLIKAAQHVRETGEATPANWQPGAATLNPGPALVGRVWEVWKPKDKTG
jgi:alkyl hydroperoxide reductase subunit AhpC